MKVLNSVKEKIFGEHSTQNIIEKLKVGDIVEISYQIDVMGKMRVVRGMFLKKSGLYRVYLEVFVSGVRVVMGFLVNSPRIGKIRLIKKKV